MTPELYTDEFRSFKYLSSSPEQIDFYRQQALEINRVQDLEGLYDKNFVWPCRLEFLEQLLDMDGETVYVVEQGQMNISKISGEIDYETAVTHTVINSIVCVGHPLMFRSPPKATFDDIKEKENIIFLCTKESLENAIKLHHTGLIPHTNVGYTAVFYNKEVAEEYRSTLTNFIRKRNDALSAIARRF